MYVHLRYLFLSFIAVLGAEFDPSSLSLSPGEAGEVRCNLDCLNNCPTAKLTWIDKNGGIVLKSSSVYDANGVHQVTPPTQRTSLLQISAASQANTGTYVCRVSAPNEDDVDTPFTISLQ